MIQRVITLHQPWASAFFVPGLKSIETRSWYVEFKGALWIHAAATLPAYAKDFLGNIPRSLASEFAKLPEPLQRGVILGRVDLLGCERINQCRVCRGHGDIDGENCHSCAGAGGRPDHRALTPTEAHFGNYQVGRYAWLTDQPCILAEPIPAKGTQGIWGWEPPTDVEQLLRRVE